MTTQLNTSPNCNIPHLPILRLGFRFCSDSDVRLPPFLGSTLRGAFGTALKESYCFVPDRTCEKYNDKKELIASCWFKDVCEYQYLFETPNPFAFFKELSNPRLKGQSDVPQPFVLIIPEPKLKAGVSRKTTRIKNIKEDFEGNDFRSGDELMFGITLIGKAVNNWGRIVLAVRLMADTGLGEGRSPFMLTQAFVYNENGNVQTVFSNESPSIFAQGIVAEDLSQIVNNKFEMVKNSNRVRIRFLTPLRRVIKNGSYSSLDFKHLIKKLVHRLEDLAAVHSDPPQFLNFGELINSEAHIQITYSSFQQYEWEQYSKRLGYKTIRRGFFGEIEYEGETLPKFLPLILSGELLLIGAGTSYGVGRFEIKHL